MDSALPWMFAFAVSPVLLIGLGLLPARRSQDRAPPASMTT
jgi:hypothetical protein